MDETAGWMAKAFIVIVVFVIIFGIVKGSTGDLGSFASVLGVVAGLGGLAATFGVLKMTVNWAQ